MNGLDAYITNGQYSKRTVEYCCPKCWERYYVKWETEYGHSYTDDDTVCPTCHVNLVEVGEADTGDKWDTDSRV